jgi:hypothetical protein
VIPLKFLSKISVSVISILTLIILSVSPAQAAIDTNNKLSFNSNGKFKIVVFADCQDGALPNSKMISFMNASLDYEKPDLVVFTGDNVLEFTNAGFKTGATKIIQPLIDRNIPYAYTYGNHDDQFGVSKEYQYSVYKTLGNCLTYDDDPNITGMGNCNLPIYSSDGSNIAFNLWIMDSNSYDGSTSIYDHVHQDQLDWYRRKSQAIDKQAGHKVYSIMFQHIIMPEAYQLLCEDASGSKTYAGKTYRQELNSKATGYLGEFPCPPAENGGEFDTLSAEGNVLGVVTGHDHSNDFTGRVGNIDFLQTGGMSFRSYGDVNARGYRVIELDQSKPAAYTSHTVKYTDYESGALSGSATTDVGLTEYSYTAGTKFVSEISFAGSTSVNTAKSTLTNSGFTVLDYDLNKDAGGQYIYMGYKTTENYADSIKSIRYYCDGSDSTSKQFFSLINGNHVYYNRVNDQDINNKAGGKYIYGYYTKDCLAGPPITPEFLCGQSTDVSGYTVCTSFQNTTSAVDLNKGTNNTEIYMLYKMANTAAINSNSFKQEFAQCQKMVENYDIQSKFGDKYTQAEELINSLTNSGATSMTQAQIDTLTQQLATLRHNIKFDIKFYSDDGLVSSASKPLEQSYTLPTSTPQKQHNLFMGWSTQENSETVNYNPGDVYSEEKDLTLHAVWKPYSKIFFPKTEDSAVVDYDNCFIYGLPIQLNSLINNVATIDGYGYDVENVRQCLATGSKVSLHDGNGKVLDTYSVVIFGDVNSDGVYDGQDAVIVNMLAQGMLTKAQVGDAVYLAADCNHDGTIDAKDISILEQAGTYLSTVDQTKPLTSSTAGLKYVNLISQVPNEDVQQDNTDSDSNSNSNSNNEKSLFERIYEIIMTAIKGCLSFFK